MSQSVVCKMKCHSVAKATEQSETTAVRLGAVWEPDEEKRAKGENAIFGRYTPWADCNMGIANPEALAMFETGQSYYVTFTKAPE